MKSKRVTPDTRDASSQTSELDVALPVRRRNRFQACAPSLRPADRSFAGAGGADGQRLAVEVAKVGESAGVDHLFQGGLQPLGFGFCQRGQILPKKYWIEITLFANK